MTSVLYVKSFENDCILPSQCETKAIHEKPSSTGNVNEGVIHSLLIC